MSAVRVARAATGRDLVLKFDGCYHGHADAFLADGGGSGLATFGIPRSPGVTDGAVRRLRRGPGWRVRARFAARSGRGGRA